MISLFDKLDSLRSYEEKQNFSSNKYVQTFCAQLEQLGAECRVSDAIPFITPGDSIIKRETESVVPASCPPGASGTSGQQLPYTARRPAPAPPRCPWRR